MRLFRLASSGGREATGDRLLDLAFCVAVCVATASAILRAEGEHCWTLVLLTIVLVNVFVSVLFAIRRRALVRPTPRAILASLPSFMAGVFALSLAPAPIEWPLPVSIAFFAGGMIAAVSLATLGPSFAIFPALRSVVTVGPYRIVRHPAYAGQLLMVAAAASAVGVRTALWVAPLMFAFLILRIRVEERLLRGSPRYREYAFTCRYRLVPGVW